MNCEEIRELLSAYANEELAPEAREKVAAHLAGCADCRKALEEFRDVRRQVESLRIAPAAPDAAEAVMSRIASRKTAGLFGSWRRRALAFVPVIIALIAVLVLQPWHTVLSPQAVLANTHSALEKLQSYRMTYRVYEKIGNDTVIGEMKTEYSAPDRYHFIETRDGEVEESILLGTDYYYKEGMDPGTLAFVQISNGSLFLSKESTLELLDILRDIEELPEEEIDGVRCIRLRGYHDFEKMLRAEAKGQAEMGIPPMSEAEIQERLEKSRDEMGESIFELWIGPDDYLLRKLVNYQIPGDTRIEYTLTDFNEPITIETPRDANGNLLEGWKTTVPDAPVFDAHVSVELDNHDAAGRGVDFNITLTNVSDAAVTRVDANSPTITTSYDEVMLSKRFTGDVPSLFTPGVSVNCTVSFMYDATTIDSAAAAAYIESSGLQITYRDPDGEYKMETVPFEMPDAFYDLPLTTMVSYDVYPVGEYRVDENGASIAWGGTNAEIDGHRYYFVVVNTQNSDIAAPPGILVLDIDDPENPARIAWLPASTDTRYLGLVSIAGTMLYIHADGYLWIVDVSDPSNPAEIGKSTGLRFSEMVVQGQYGFSDVSNEGIVVFDLSDPASPQRVGAFEMTPRANRSLLLHEGYLLVEEQDILYTIDISSPESLQIIDSRRFEVPGGGTAHIGEISVEGDDAYIILRNDDAGGGVLVFDVSSPPNYRETAFVEIRNRHLMGFCFVAGDRLFVDTMAGFSMDRRDRFDIIDISDPQQPVHVGYTYVPEASSFFEEWDGSGYSAGFREVDDYLYWFIGNSPNQPVIEIFDPDEWG